MTQRYILNHYAYSGFTVSIGVLAITLIGYLFASMEVAAGLAMGAICVSICDVPTPARHKLLETSLGLVLGTLVVALIGYNRNNPWLLGASVLGVSFAAAMVTAYGRKAMPLSFALFFTMVLSLGSPIHREQHHYLVGIFVLGGSLYLGYAVAVSRFLSFRTRQQALGECIHELANYLRIQGNFFDNAVPMENCHQSLIDQQAVVAEKLQNARDLLFRQLKSDKDGMLAATLVKSLELFEHLLSRHVDYAGLRGHYAGSDLLLFFRDLARKAADDLEHVGLTLLQGKPEDSGVSYKAEMYAIEYEMSRLRQQARQSSDGESTAQVINVYDRTLQGLELIAQVRRASHTPVPVNEAVEGVPVEHFLSRPRLSLKGLLNNLTLDSPVFRYSLRVVLAMACGYWIDLVLPYTAHGYWILLTIAVIMRSSYSQTRKRQWDRISGNVIGCVFAAFLLWTTKNPVVLMAVVFLAVGIAHAQTNQNYRYTAIAACLMGLLPTQFIEPDVRFLIAERLLDTGVGALIAWSFSFVLPNWEYKGIPGLTAKVLKACAAYTRLSLDMEPDDLRYRLARKQMIDAIAALGAASRRMLDDPESRRHAVGPLNAFISASYLLVAQLASTRLLLQQRGAELDRKTLPARLTSAATAIEEVLLPNQTMLAAPVPAASPASIQGSNAEVLLAQRLTDLRDGAKEIHELSQYLGNPAAA
ncbi:MAG TPA: FUSC family membrane protein [Rhodocyclaceae bacterium]|nr:FUSC family membrane protein [Rhodocyclaceae bacterium]